MIQKILTVPYHGQFDPKACGAACLKMAIETIGGTTASEVTLFSETKTADWGGGSPPDKIAEALKERGGQKASTVVVAQKIGVDAEAELIQRMIWSIRNAGVPPIALVAWDEHSDTGDGHWVIVAGYHADRHPTGPTDAECVVSAFEFNNPATAAEDQTYPNHVSYKWWRSRYMKPVGNDKEGYAGNVVAVTAGTLSSA